MKSNLIKYLAPGLALFTIIAVGACAKPETTSPPETPKPAEFVITELAISPDIVMPNSPTHGNPTYPILALPL
jgi:hypothetical protein